MFLKGSGYGVLRGGAIGQAAVVILGLVGNIVLQQEFNAASLFGTLIGAGLAGSTILLLLSATAAAGRQHEGQWRSVPLRVDLRVGGGQPSRRSSVCLLRRSHRRVSKRRSRPEVTTPPR